MCVQILLCSAILFISKITDHVIAAKYPYDEIPGGFKRGNPISGESGKKKYYFVKPILF